MTFELILICIACMLSYSRSKSILLALFLGIIFSWVYIIYYLITDGNDESRKTID